MNKIFREYDIRGLYEKDLNEKSVKAIGLALGEHFANKGVKTLSVGYDARLSAENMFIWLLSGLHASYEKLKIYNIGMLPTPVGYYSVFTDKFDANIMITGSHNPKEYNGFKITIGQDSLYGKELAKVGKRAIQLLDSKVTNNTSAIKYDILTQYVEFYEKEFTHLKGWNYEFVVDCGNGTAGISSTKICEALNLKAKFLYPNPDGNFPNHHPDPSIKENLTDLKSKMDKSGIKLGFAFDGDSDRIAVLTPKRNIKGDELASLFALNINKPKILGEVKCSQVMYDFIESIGGTAIMCKTGHSNIKKAIKESGADLGAEVSGHIYFKERFFGFDDGVYAMFRVLELVKNGFELDSELDKLPVMYSTDEIKIETTDELKFEIVERLKKELKNPNFTNHNNLPEILEICEIDGIRVKFQNGWALVRASNTTPVIVTRFESKTPEFRDELQNKFSKILENISS
ncbi:MAG: phosphomannomutase/phosphoglucomutase [Campylobacter sp.]|nr:phosphomannomutase/phosphoglucomutase [Campylobacter sp.]